MIWIVALTLALALWRLSEQLKTVKRESEDLALRIALLESERAGLADATPSPVVADAAARPPTVERPEPETPPAAPSEPEPVPVPQERPAPKPWTPPKLPPPPPRPVRPAINLGELLAEKGLAWLGGAALVLGGVFLVGYAATQGLLTPVVRLIAAVGLAGLMLLTSEVLRRRPGPRNQALASAVLAGAGAGTLYATLWAAHALYAYIGPAAAALLLLAVSALLLGLSIGRREPLALLAIAGALAAPLLTRPEAWSETALALHLLAIAATGLGLALRRQWPRTALTAAAGALTLNLLMAPQGETWRLALVPILLAALAIAYRARATAAAPRPAAAVAPVSVALAALCLLIPFGHPEGRLPVLAGLAAVLALLGMTGLAARRQWASPWLLIAPAAVLILGLALTVFVHGPETIMIGRIGALICAALLTFTALYARPSASPENPPVAIGPVAVLLLSLIAGFALPIQTQALVILFGAVPSALAAAWLARGSQHPHADLHLDAWALTAIAGLLLAIRIGVQDIAQPAAFALAALGVALLQRRLAWRGLSLGALIAAGMAVATAFSPDLVARVLAKVPDNAAGPVGLGVCFAAAALLALAAWRFRPAAPFAAGRQVLGAAAAGLALLGAFLGLRLAATGDGAILSPLMEASLRSLLLALSGASALLILRDLKGVIVRWSPHVPLGLAALSIAALQLVWFNPWWGVDPQPLEAIPLLDTLLVAFLAPAAAFMVAALRLNRRGQTAPARLYGLISAGLAFVWAVLEVRHLFHGPILTLGETRFAEICAYGLILTGLPLALRYGTPASARDDGAKAGESAAVITLPLAALGLCAVFTPWWGLNAMALGPPALAALLLAATTGLTVLNARYLKGLPREAALVIATAMAFTLATLATRFAFHPGDLGSSTVIGIETWTFSALWALLGAGLLALGSWRGERALRWTALLILFATAGKVLVFDMGRLDGVTRAGSFLAVGALMIAAAVVARRIGRSPPPGT